jgi:multicomponent Na+:H+ antiporter subunit D
MNAVVLPIILPLLTALVALFWWRPSRARRAAVALATTAQLGVAVSLLAQTAGGAPLALGVGGWGARAGIVIVVDALGALMVLLSCVTVLGALVYGFAESRVAHEHPLRLPLIQFILMGINLSFSTGDLFNLFVGFEVMLISSYALLTLEADDWEIKQAYPYLALNLVGSTLFICAAGLMYTLAGTLNFALLHERLAVLGDDPRLLVLGFMLLFVFALKAGVFPLHYWLPNSYPTLAAPLAAIFAGLLTKVGVYVLIRVLGTVLPHTLTPLHETLAVLAGFTLVAGALGSVARGFVRGVLSFQVVAAVGAMTIALGWFTPAAVAACVFYLVQDVVLKAGLFLAGGVAARLSGGDLLSRMGGLWKPAPAFGVVFLLLALSLAGVPPLSGFWAKLALLRAGIAGGAYAGVALLLAASVLTLVAMLRIWHAAFWRPAATPPDFERRGWRGMALVAALFAAGSVALGLCAEPVYRVARAAALGALEPAAYLQAVHAVEGKEGRGASP